jgi:RecG-like helicase
LSQTENSEANSERIRKIYAKDAKVGEVIHTVFRALGKEKHQSRGGKPYLSLSLVDRTGEIDGRVFDNVNAADSAFSNDDYLLVKGKVGTFHGKTQLVIDQLERLDPGPIDPAEFAWVPPAPAAAPASTANGKPDRESHQELKVRLSKRLERLLQNPQLAQALDTFVAHLEKAVLAEHGHAPPPKPERHEKPARAPRPPREPKPKVEHKSGPPEPKRDPSLPEGLAFKPFTALVPGSEEKPAEAAAAPAAAETPNP